METRLNGLSHMFELLRKRIHTRHEAEYNVRIAVMKMALMMNIVFALIQIGISFASDEFSEFVLLLEAYALINVVLLVWFRMAKRVQAIGILLILVQNFLLFPVFFLQGGGIFSGVAFILILGLMMSGYLIPGTACLAFVFIEIGTYVLFFRNLYQDKYHKNEITSTKVYFGSMMIIYLFIGVEILMLIRQQRKQIEEEKEKMVESQKQIERTSAAKEHFLTSMSHEIRTPMNSIIGLTEIMLREDIDKDVKADLMKVKQASEELLAIIDDVLTYSKLDSGEVKQEECEFRMDELITNICEIASKEIGDRDIAINVTLEHEIPRTLYGQSVYIKNIFLYMVFMVLERLEEGKIYLQASVKDRAEDDSACTLRIRLAEEGNGLSAFDLKMMLGSYQVYDTRQSSNLKGMGMKFKICEELVKIMHGTFEVQSIEDIGMAVTICLPLGIHDSSPMIEVKNSQSVKVLVYLETEKEQRIWATIFEDLGVQARYVRNKENFDKAILDIKYDFIFLNYVAYEDISDVMEKYECEENTYVLGKSSSTMGDFGKCRVIKKPVSCLSISKVLNGEWTAEMYQRDESKEVFTAKHAKILVVDDNFVNLKVAKGIFKKYEIDIDMAGSGKEALEMMEQHRYDMVFLDQMMPEMDGIETLKRIRDHQGEYFSKVPIVALTASKGGDIRAQLTRAGFQDFIVKPIKLRYLEETLKRFLPDNLKEIREAVEEQKPEEKPVGKTKEIDKTLQTEKGLMNLGYDQEGYFAVLNTYYKEGVDKCKHLPDLLEVGDIQLFTTNVHGIKSASGAVGAMYVSELFRQLEMAGKKNDLTFIREHFEESMKEFESMLEIVKNYLTTKDRFEALEEEIDLSDQEEVSMDREALEEFRKHVNNMNLSACDTFLAEFVTKNYGSELNAKVRQMKTAYDGFDFHNVKKVLNELLS